MESQTKNCQNCQTDFFIDERDLSYYKKIDVLPPKLCPECRAQLRLSFRNERFFYKRKCDNCEQAIISMYSANKPYPAWCSDCWWSDKLDSKQYGIDFDFNRPFFEQLNSLINKVPKPALVGFRNINSHYLNFTADNKSCYMIIESSNNENCINCYWIQLSKDLVDCSFTNQVELSYEVDDCYDSSNLRFAKGCHSCLDSAFLIDCRGCTNCLGCINLRGQQYYIFNQPYSKEEYFQKLKSFRLDTYSGIEAFKKQFADFIKNKPRKFAEVTNAKNSTGNYMVNVKNNKQCFHSYEAEDNSYCVHAWRDAKDCMDSNTAGRNAALIYNSLNTGLQASNVMCSFYCWGSQFIEYCLNCPNSNNCFGCVGLIKGSYCIFNKQYSKEDYHKLRTKIIENMKEAGVYGEFFPKHLSPLGYNESSAIDECPLTKEEALKQDFKWEDTERGTYNKETIKWENFPDSILNLPQDFDASKEIFACMDCSKNYIVIPDELIFYQKMEIPIPRVCPECRHIKRFKNRGPNKTWHRSCMCKDEHHEHKGNCPNEFETPFSPEHSEVIYCENCYKKEVY